MKGNSPKVFLLVDGMQSVKLSDTGLVGAVHTVTDWLGLKLEYRVDCITADWLGLKLK